MLRATEPREAGHGHDRGRGQGRGGRALGRRRGGRAGWADRRPRAGDQRRRRGAGGALPHAALRAGRARPPERRADGRAAALPRGRRDRGGPAGAGRARDPDLRRGGRGRPDRGRRLHARPHGPALLRRRAARARAAVAPAGARRVHAVGQGVGMATSGLFATKPVDELVAETKEGTTLTRAVGLLDLTALGIGAIIGTGIFVILGEVVGDAGPAIILSFVLAGVTCVFSALSYAELASTIPVSGSAYTYGYATMGELIAWIIGWDLILEYAVSVAAIAVGWGQDLNELLDYVFGISLPTAIATAPGEGGTVNVPAVFLVLAVTALLIVGVRESARANTIMVFIKLAVVVLFLALAVTGFKSGNLKPFAPYGFDGIVTAASVVFFAYIGFDAISTSGEEVKRPARDLPIAIIGSLAICTLLYLLVAIAAPGPMPYTQLNGQEAPLAQVLQSLGFTWSANIISLGALVAITSVTLTVLYGQTRIMFAMCRDGLLPRGFAKISRRRRTPSRITASFCFLIAILAAFVPLAEIAKLVNIGTLFAFVITNIGVIVLRRTRPDLERGFRVPLVPLFPIIGAGLAIFLMKYLERDTWIRFGVWLLIGLVIYFAYGRRHSLLRRGQVINPEAELPAS